MQSFVPPLLKAPASLLRCRPGPPLCCAVVCCTHAQVLTSKLLERSPQDEVARAFTLFDLQQTGRITTKELALIARQLQVCVRAYVLGWVVLRPSHRCAWVLESWVVCRPVCWGGWCSGLHTEAHGRLKVGFCHGVNELQAPWRSGRDLTA